MSTQRSQTILPVKQHAKNGTISQHILKLLGLRLCAMISVRVFKENFVNNLIVYGISTETSLRSEQIIDNGRSGDIKTIALLLYPENPNDPKSNKSRLRDTGSLYRCDIKVLPQRNARKLAVSIAANLKRGYQITKNATFELTPLASKKMSKNIPRQSVDVLVNGIEILLSSLSDCLKNIRTITIQKDKGFLTQKDSCSDIREQCLILERLNMRIDQKCHALGIRGIHY